jgi:uncharacterized membrane protein YkoI
MRKIIIAGILYVAFYGVYNTQLFADDKNILLAEVPKNVKAAVLKAFPGVELTEAAMEDTKSGKIYRLKGKLDKQIYEFKINADGTQLKQKIDNDDGGDIPLTEIPETVKATAYKALEGIVFKTAKRKTKKTEIIYELEGKIDEHIYEFKIKADGTLLKIELQ